MKVLILVDRATGRARSNVLNDVTIAQVHQHASKKHLHRYMAEFDFRYSHRVACGFDDEARTVKALESVVGKRLTYRRPDERPQA